MVASSGNFYHVYDTQSINQGTKEARKERLKKHTEQVVWNSIGDDFLKTNDNDLSCRTWPILKNVITTVCRSRCDPAHCNP
jgi:hypothetical protein